MHSLTCKLFTLSHLFSVSPSWIHPIILFSSQWPLISFINTFNKSTTPLFISYHSILLIATIRNRLLSELSHPLFNMLFFLLLLAVNYIYISIWWDKRIGKYLNQAASWYCRWYPSHHHHDPTPQGCSRKAAFVCKWAWENYPLIFGNYSSHSCILLSLVV